MASILYILYRRVVVITLLALVMLFSVTGCRVYRLPTDYIRSYEEELKKEYPYVRMVSASSGSPHDIDWICRISEEKTYEEIYYLVEELKRFALDEATSKALSETIYFGPLEEMSSVAVIVVYVWKNVEIYKGYCSPKFERFIWSPIPY